MYMGKVFWGLKSSSLHNTGNTFCFHSCTLISSATSVGTWEGGVRWMAEGPATDQQVSCHWLGLPLSLQTPPENLLGHIHTSTSQHFPFVSSCPQPPSGDTLLWSLTSLHLQPHHPPPPHSMWASLLGSPPPPLALLCASGSFYAFSAQFYSLLE